MRCDSIIVSHLTLHCSTVGADNRTRGCRRYQPEVVETGSGNSGCWRAAEPSQNAGRRGRPTPPRRGADMPMRSAAREKKISAEKHVSARTHATMALVVRMY